jgi:uncharacterized membrane protein
MNRSRSPLATFTTALPMLLLSAAAARAQSSFTVIGDLPGGPYYADVRAVSADGTTAVGSSYSSTPGFDAMEGYVWTAATGIVGQGDLPGGPWGSYDSAVSGTGSRFVGYSYSALGNQAHKNMAPIPMYPAGGFDSRATGISDDGLVVCGYSFLPSGAYEGWSWASTVAPPVGVGDLPGGSFYSLALSISGDGHFVVGESESASGIEAFRKDLTSGAMIGLGDLPGAAFHSRANGASYDGSVVVGDGTIMATGDTSPFRWTAGGGMVALTTGVGSAEACNADGSIVVGKFGYGSTVHAFLWDAAHGLRDLNLLLVSDYGLGSAIAGWTLLEATDVSADGRTIVGHGYDPAGIFQAWIVHLGVGPMTSFCLPSEGGVIGCPCGNPPLLAGTGCDNSSHTGGAMLAASGTPSLSADTLVFTTSGEKPTALSIVLQGPTSLATGAVFGQGVRCVGGSLKRLYTKSASGGSITAPGAGDPSVHVRSAALGDTITAGTDRFYMVYYRDATVVGGCPAASTFNATQGGRVSWAM